MDCSIQPSKYAISGDTAKYKIIYYSSSSFSVLFFEYNWETLTVSRLAIKTSTPCCIRAFYVCNVSNVLPKRRVWLVAMTELFNTQ